MIKKYDRKIIAAISDSHAWHALGLCNPNTVLENIENGKVKQYNPVLTETQKFIWETYDWGVSEIMALAQKDQVILIHNGDPTHGTAGFLQKNSTRMSDQIITAIANIEVWLKYPNVKYVRFTVGTGLHEMGEGSASILIASELRRTYKNTDIGVVYHGLLDVGGITIDYAHHGPYIGSRKWLEGNELRYYLRSIMMNEIMAGKTPPHIVLRGHYHVYRREFLDVEVNGNTYESWAILLPGLTFKDDYTRRATKSEYKQTVGMVAIEIINNNIYKIHKFTRSVDIRTKEKI